MKSNKLLVLGLAAGTVLAARAEISQDGGQLCIWPENPGKFLFVDAQDQVPATAIETPALQIVADFNFNGKVVKGKAPDLRGVAGELKTLDANGAIWVVNDPKLPVVLSAVEDGWGVLNVAPLVADNPDEKKRDERVTKEINRLFGFLHGCYDASMMPGCVMKPAFGGGVKTVDAVSCVQFSPESVNKITSFLRGAGYRPAKRGSYYDACEEGWAPAPTNDVQRAIWSQISSDKERGPSKPLTIAPPKKN